MNVGETLASAAIVCKVLNMQRSLGDLAKHRARTGADREMCDLLEALVDVDGGEEAPASLLYAMQAGGQAVRIRIGNRDVAIALTGASDANPRDVWAAIRQIAS